jgi:hypothetical protein
MPNTKNQVKLNDDALRDILRFLDIENWDDFARVTRQFRKAFNDFNYHGFNARKIVASYKLLRAGYGLELPDTPQWLMLPNITQFHGFFSSKEFKMPQIYPLLNTAEQKSLDKVRSLVDLDKEKKEIVKFAGTMQKYLLGEQVDYLKLIMRAIEDLHMKKLPLIQFRSRLTGSLLASSIVGLVIYICLLSAFSLIQAIRGIEFDEKSVEALGMMPIKPSVIIGALFFLLSCMTGGPPLSGVEKNVDEISHLDQDDMEQDDHEMKKAHKP